ncbi:hypothetical protein SAMN02745704_00434 [Paucidesulfovibrio gracilis DSM 16080]|uniref:VPLPA-CTERM protein sorting domain-containing protein n=1 Tax=Paucidesulfovibrio gracilis DSM 16080 TaxID=1121449 RepID=A0A1T4W5K1_9BACT|nr:hypothetical protein [Paucidesulfovibrio gracilis]SKA72550.1 hypothetical protein SAMN02745704_00434 [Paucidesulfovibrio gracilis DSM 16080]
MRNTITAVRASRTMRLTTTALLLGLLLLAAGPARAATMGFEAVEGLFPTGSIFMDVDGNDDAATFTLRNTGDGAITAIYFDWGAMAGLFGDPSNVDDSLPGVTYTDSQGDWYSATPWNMPGGAGLDDPFVADFGLGPQHRGGVPNNGIGEAEFLSVTWNLAGLDFQTLLNAMNNGEIRVGLHVQSLADGSSASGISATPIQGTLLLLSSGLLGLLVFRHRTRD